MHYREALSQYSGAMSEGNVGAHQRGIVQRKGRDTLQINRGRRRVLIFLEEFERLYKKSCIREREKNTAYIDFS